MSLFRHKFFFSLIIFCLFSGSLALAAVPASDDGTIRILYGESRIIKAADISRVLSSDSSIVGVHMLSSAAFQVIGNSVGTTFVHYWTPGGRTSVRVIVSQMMQNAAAGAGSNDTPGWFSDSSFSYTYSFNQNYIHYYSPESDQNSSLYNHFINLGTSIPLGKILSNIRMESVNGGLVRLTDWRTFLYGQGYTAGVGDLSATLTEFTAPGVSYQGLSWASSFSGLPYSLYWGARNKPWWGGFTGGRPDTFIGAMTELPQFFGNYWTLALGETRDGNGSNQNRVIGLRSRTNWNAWDLTSELGLSQNGLAFKTEAAVINPNYHFSAILRNIGPRYEALSGGVSYVGVTGIFLKGDYKPWERMSTYASYDYYYNFLSGNPLKPNYPNNNLNLGLGYDFTPWPFVSLGYSRGDSQGYLNGGVYDGIYAGLSQYLDFIFRFNGYVRLGKTNFDVPTLPENSYSSESKSAGLNVAFMPNLSLTLDRNYDRKTFKQSGLVDNQRTDRADFNWFGPFSFSPLSLNAGYISFTSGDNFFDYTQTYGGASLSYLISQNLSFSLGGRIAETKSPNNFLNNRNDKNLFGSVTYLFDTSVNRLPRVVTGVIFEDINGNGQYDSLEPGLAGVVIILNDNYFTRSDAKGMFSFVNLNTSGITVKIKEDDKTGLSFPRGDVFKLTVGPGENKNLSISVQPKTAVKGFVYEDSNNNGIFDITEKKLPGCQVVIDGLKNFNTNNDGYYLIGVESGSHLLKLDPATLPLNYFGANPDGQKVNVAADEVKELNIPVLNLRSLGGTVFVDKNLNSHFDATLGETGFSGVRLLLDGRQETISESDGSFTLKEVAAGPHILKVSLPKNYKLETEFILQLEKEAEGRVEMNLGISPRFNYLIPVFNANLLKISPRASATGGQGIVAGGITATAPPEESLMKVKFFPTLAVPGKMLKIQASFPARIKIEKLTAVFPEITRSLKLQSSAGGWQVWAVVYPVPVGFSGRYLDFKIFVRAFNITIPSEKFSVEVNQPKVETSPDSQPAAEAPPAPMAESAVPAAEPLVTAEKQPASTESAAPILKDSVKITVLPESLKRGMIAKIFVRLPAAMEVSKMAVVLGKKMVTMKQLTPVDGQQVWQGAAPVPTKIDGHGLKFKVFLKAKDGQGFSESRLLEIGQ